MLYLISKELTEVLHVHLVSFGVNDRGEAIEFDLIVLQVLDRDDDIGQLADSGRLYEDPVRIVLLYDLVQSFSEVSDESTADAACNHLIDLNARFSEKSRINADLSEFVLDQYDVLCLITFRYKFFDKCSFACSEKPGENIYFCHLFCLPSGHYSPFIRIGL